MTAETGGGGEEETWDSEVKTTNSPVIIAYLFQKEVRVVTEGGVGFSLRKQYAMWRTMKAVRARHGERDTERDGIMVGEKRERDRGCKEESE